jgi:hypothetical protein
MRRGCSAPRLLVLRYLRIFALSFLDVPATLCDLWWISAAWTGLALGMQGKPVPPKARTCTSRCCCIANSLLLCFNSVPVGGTAVGVGCCRGGTSGYIATGYPGAPRRFPEVPQDRGEPLGAALAKPGPVKDRAFAWPQVNYQGRRGAAFGRDTVWGYAALHRNAAARRGTAPRFGACARGAAPCRYTVPQHRSAEAVGGTR